MTIFKNILIITLALLAGDTVLFAQTIENTTGNHQLITAKKEGQKYAMKKVSLIDDISIEVIDIEKEWDNLPQEKRDDFIDEVKNGRDFQEMVKDASVLKLRKIFLKTPTKDNANNLREAVFEYRRIEMKGWPPEKIQLLKSEYALRRNSALSNSSGKPSAPSLIINQKSKIINSKGAPGGNAKSNSGGSGKGASGGNAKGPSGGNNTFANSAYFITDRPLTNSINLDLAPRIATDGNGNIYVAYVDNQNDQVRVDKSTDGGYTWTNSTTYTSTDIEWLDIRIDGNNYVYVSYDYMYSASDCDLYLRKSTNGGSTWTTYTIDATGEDTRWNTMAIDGSNNIVVVYGHWDTFWGGYELGYIKSTDGGVTWPSYDYDGVDNLTGSTDYCPHIDAGFGNYFYVVYSYNGDDIEIKNSTTGTSWSGYDLIENCDVSAIHFPSVAASKDNQTVVVVWWDNFNGTGDLDAQRDYSTTGQTISSFGSNVGAVSNSGSYDEYYPQVCWSSDYWAGTTNYFYVVYLQRGVSETGAFYTKFAYATEALPGTWTINLDVSDGQNTHGDYNGSRPAIGSRKGTADANKYPAIVWADNRGAGATNIYYSTYGRYYTITTNPAGFNVTVDGITNPAPQSFDWPAGVSHTLNVPSPQSGCTWSSWSNAGAQSHSITTDYGSTTTTITATFSCSKTGYFTSPAIAIQGGSACGSWTEAGWTQTLAGGTVVMELCDAGGTPIPGWTNTQAGDGVKTWDISALNPVTYPSIRLRANLSGPANSAQVNSWYARFTVQGDATNYVWNGSVSTAWNNASNWCGGGGGWPNSTTKNVIIKSSFGTLNYPQVNDATAACNNLTIENGRSLYVNNALQVNGELWINTGAIVEHQSGTITLAGNWRQDGGYNRTTSATAVTLIGTAKQIYGVNTPYFGNLSLANPSSYTINGPGLNVWTTGGAGGALSINLNGSLNANGKPMEVQGNWNNTSGTFTHGSNTVTFNGGNATITTGGTGAGKIFYNVVCDASTNTKTLGGNINIDGNFTITSGTWDVSAIPYNMNVAGNWTNNGTFNNGGTGLVEFDYFTDGNYTANPVWTPQVGAWTATINQLEGQNDGVNNKRISVLSTQPYGTWEFIYSFEVATTNAILRYFIIMSADNADPGNAAADGYYVWIDGGLVAGARLQLRRLNNGVGTTLITSDWIPGTAWHTIKVTRSAANVFELFYDGISQGTSSDATYASSSYMGVWNTGNIANDNHRIDNIRTSSGSGGTVTFDGTLSQNVLSGGDAFYNITMNNSSTGITVQDNVTVNKTLTLTDGVITTGSYYIILLSATSSDLTGFSNNSFINGNLRRYIAANLNTYAFPLGNGTAATNYYLAELLNGNLTGISYINSRFGALANHLDADIIASEESTPYTTVGTEGVWYLDPDAIPTGGNYDLKCYIANISALLDNQFSILKRPSGSLTAADWTCTPCGFGDPGINAGGGAGRMVADGYALRMGLSSFSQFGLGKSGGPLPVELLYFIAECKEKHVELNWATASETNNDYFTIERTTDGETFEIIGTKSGAGNSYTVLSYEFTDVELPTAAATATFYYRLKQTDYDGKYEYSHIVALNCREPLKDVVNVYANGKKEVIIEFVIPEDKKFNASLIDATGKTVIETTLNTTKGTNAYIMDAQYLTTGIYLVIVRNEDEYIAKKVLLH